MAQTLDPWNVEWNNSPRFVLGAGDTALWPIDISFGAVDPEAVTLTLRVNDGAVEPRPAPVTADPWNLTVERCADSWTDGRYSGAAQPLLTASFSDLKTAGGLVLPLQTDAVEHRLLIRVTLNESDAAYSTVSATTENPIDQRQLSIRINASGELLETGSPDGLSAGSSAGSLATTGFALAGFAFLGLFAVAIGLGIAAAAGQRRHQPTERVSP